MVSSGTASGINVDLTIEDYFSIPINIQAKTDPNALIPTSTLPANNQYTSRTQTMVSALAQAVSASAGTNASIYSTTPVGDPAVNPATLPDPNFVRAVSPNQAPELYHTWTNYLDALAAGGALNVGGTNTINISDNYGGSGAGTGAAFEAQTYGLTVTVDSSAQTLTISGTTSTIDGVLTIVSTFDDLNAAGGIYGNNAAFTWSIGSGPHDGFSTRDFRNRIPGARTAQIKSPGSF